MRAIVAAGLAALTLCGATVVAPAQAADLAYPPAPVFNEPDAQMEFGTGWYLRGDASFGPEDRPLLTTTGFKTRTSDWGWGVGGGFGYRFNSFLRADVTGDYFGPTTTASSITIPGFEQITKATLQRYDGLANLYIDLGTWYGLTPYIGGGAGVGVVNPSVKVVSDATLTAIGAPSSQTNFAWAAMAGVSYQFDPNMAVDVGYRHLDLGRFATTLAGFAIDRHLTQDDVRLGIRYMIN